MNELLLVLAALAGTFSHWAKDRYATKEIGGNPVDYLITHPANTITMFAAVLMACSGLITAHQLTGMTPAAVVMLGFTTGWTADSAFNKGPRP